MSIFSRKPKPPSEPEPARELDESERDDQRRWAASVATAQKLREWGIPELTRRAREYLCDIAYDDGFVDAYNTPDGIWRLAITPRSDSRQYPPGKRIWTARAFNDFMMGRHASEPPHLCMCEACLHAREGQERDRQ